MTLFDLCVTLECDYYLLLKFKVLYLIMHYTFCSQFNFCVVLKQQAAFSGLFWKALSVNNYIRGTEIYTRPGKLKDYRNAKQGLPCLLIFFWHLIILIKLLYNLMPKPSRHSCRKSSVEKCIFDYMTLHIECRFNKNSLLQCYFLAIFPAGKQEWCEIIFLLTLFTLFSSIKDIGI